ncbi:MAG TPA: hypothetical protein VGD99_21570, partial [Anaerolineae bacterium]
MQPRLHAIIRHFIAPIVFLLILILSSRLPLAAQAAPPAPICTPPIQPVTLSSPTVITNCGSPAQLQTALAAGGH